MDGTAARIDSPCPASRRPGGSGRSTGVVVIGAGVIGCAVAYYLARRGVRVTVLEAGGIASGSSGACDGLVFMQSKKPGVHLELALEGLALFAELRTALPFPIGFVQRGGMIVIETETEMAAMERFAARQREIGLPVALMDGAEARRMEPGLSAHILGATHSPLDGQVDPIALTRALAQGARDLGAAVIPHAPVERMILSEGRVAAVETPRGRFRADAFVNAAGVLAPEIGRMAGLRIPITPRRGQLIVTRACPGRIRCCLLSADYIAAKYRTDPDPAGGHGVSIEQTENGNFLLGSTREFVGFDRRTTPEGLRHIAARATRILPALGAVSVLRAFAGLRPYTPDGLPILGPAPDVSGLYLAAGHEGDGIALSAITGKLMAQLIEEGRTDIPLEAFRPERFSETGPEKALPTGQHRPWTT